MKRTETGNGDGWVRCSMGHRHWGRFGAAGLLIRDGHAASAPVTESVILQHRAAWTHEGDRWGVPGGARNSDEDVVGAALREAGEEAGVVPHQVKARALLREDHGGWSYTTVIADALDPLEPHAANSESTQVRWWRQDQVPKLPLHHGLAAAWPLLTNPPRPTRWIIDATTVTSPTWQALGTAINPVRHASSRRLTHDESQVPQRTWAVFPDIVVLTRHGCEPLLPAQAAWWHSHVTIHPTNAADLSGFTQGLAVQATSEGNDVLLFSDNGALAKMPCDRKPFAALLHDGRGTA